VAHFNANEGTYTPDRLVIGTYRAVKVTIASGGGILARGTLLGQITASAKRIKSLSAAADGSQLPESILAEAVDATAADIETTAYIAGEFDVDAVIFGAAHTAASVDRELRRLGIFLSKTQG
jgi:hypothetical protein